MSQVVLYSHIIGTPALMGLGAYLYYRIHEWLVRTLRVPPVVK